MRDTHQMEEKLEPLQVAVGVSMSKPANLSLTMPAPLMQTLLPLVDRVRCKTWNRRDSKNYPPTGQFPDFYHRYSYN